MKTVERVKAIIEYAKTKGFNFQEFINKMVPGDGGTEEIFYETLETESPFMVDFVIRGVFLSPEFAKAFFGTYKIDLNHFCEIEIYKYHITEMIKDGDYLTYMENYINR